jgi:hypothetical protein
MSTAKKCSYPGEINAGCEYEAATTVISGCHKTLRLTARKPMILVLFVSLATNLHIA